MPVDSQGRARLLMGLRALAFILAWPFVIPPIVRLLGRVIPAIVIKAPPPGQVLPTGGLIVAEIVCLAIAAALTALLLLTERETGKRFGALPVFATRTNLSGGPGWLVPGHAAGIDTLAGAAGAALFGLFACLTLRATGNLWFAIGWHAGWDFTERQYWARPMAG